MFEQKIIFLLIAIFLVTSCADTWSSVKRGMTGQKAGSTDEFLVKKKDPLILPPDFEQLPTPAEQEIAQQEISSLKKSLKNISQSEN